MEADNILRNLPPIVRSRDFHLYTASGRRFLDLFLNGGRAYYGHRPGRLSQKLKNVLSKGLLPELPSFYEGRVCRLARKVFPDSAAFRVFRSAEEGMRFCAAFFGSPQPPAFPYDPAADPACYAGSDAGGGPVPPAAESGPSECFSGFAVLRPDFYPEHRAGRVILPLLPLAAEFFPALFCFTASPPDDAPASALVSPVLLAGLAEGLRLFYAGKDREAPNYPPLPFWRRRGRYIIASCGKNCYKKVFSVFLENGILINPRYPGPSILPEYYSDGEWKLLEEISAFCYKKWNHVS